MAKIYYFAYGSNMLSERLQARCKSARAVSIGSVEGHSLAFSKKSRDGSGKATLAPSEEADARVYGVLFELDAEELTDLDGFEGVGLGYERHNEFAVQTEGGIVTAAVYLGSDDHLDAAQRPYDWYHELVLAGAKQNQLPLDYVEKLSDVASSVDTKTKRTTRLQALELLKKVNGQHD